jgi:membrane associated rhomboid family serine protease
MPPITPPIRSTTGVVCDRPADLPHCSAGQQPRNNPWVVIPIHDRNPTSRTPYVTRALIALNAVAFLVSPLVLGGLGDSAAEAACSVQEFFDRWAAIPRELMSGEQLPLVVGPAVIDATGAPACQLVEPAYEKLPIVSAVTAMFLHGGWVHLLGNMLFLFVFGNNVEDRLGHVRYLLFFLVCGIAATYAFALTDVDARTTLVGASGAIAGVLGAYLAWYPRARVISLVPFLLFIPVPLPAWVVLSSWFVIQAFYSLGTGVAGGDVAYVSHVAGFAVGFLFGLALGRGKEPPRPVSPYDVVPYRPR